MFYANKPKEPQLMYLEARRPVEGVPSYNFDAQLQAERTIDNIRNNVHIKQMKYYLRNSWVRFSDVPVKSLIEEFISW